MTLSEFIGFIITMIAFFLLVIKQSIDQKKARQRLEEEGGEEGIDVVEEELQELLESLNIKTKPKPKPSPPPQPNLQTYKEEPIREYKKPDMTAFHLPEYQNVYTIRKEQQSRVKGAIQQTGSLKDAIIIREILGPPKSLE